MRRTGAVWRAFAVLAVLVVLGACGGGGGGGGGSSPSNGSKVFVADGGNHAIGSQINPNPGPGAVAVDRIISGPATGLNDVGGPPSPSTIPSLALDIAADQLYAATQLRVRVFNQASFAAGNVAPARTFTASVLKSGVPSGVNFFRLFLDNANNRLYVAEPDGFLHAFENASGLNGALAPGRTIQIDLGASMIAGSLGIAVDTAANKIFLGIEGNGFTSIYVFNNQSTISGLTPPDETLSFSTAPTSFYLDSVNNRLYVAVFGGDIQVFDNANSLTTGTPLPSRTIPLSLVSTTSKAIFLDAANDRLYAVGMNQIFIVNNASTISAPGFPVTVIALPDANARFSAVVAKP